MTKSFLDQGINYTPLTDLGLSREKAKQMVTVVMPLVQMKLQTKVEDVLGTDKMIEIKNKADKKQADFMESLKLIDQAYKQKTGVYVMELMRQIINYHLKILANIIKKARADEAKLIKENKLEELMKLLDENKTDEAVKLLKEFK